MSELIQLFQRDVKIYMQRKGECMAGTLFYVLVVTMFGIAVGDISPPVIWVAALLAAVITQNSIFKTDYELGFFDCLILKDTPLSLLIFIKVLVNWLLTQLPIILITPLLILDKPLEEIALLMVTLLLGTPILSLIGAIGAALTVALSQGGVLLGILVLPLYVPVLVLATGCSYAAGQGLPFMGHLALLGGIAIGTLMLAPFAVSAAIKVSVS